MRYLSKLKKKDLAGKICLLRLDFNTEDNWRLEASAPTLKFLSRECRAVVVLSHEGRPEEVKSLKLKVKRFSLGMRARAMSRLLGKKVNFINHFRFKEIKKKIKDSRKGSIFLLENLRFLKGEQKNSVTLAKKLASLGDIYVNDAFAVSHRKNASVAAITKCLPSYAGFEIESEIKNLSRAIKNPKKPLVVIFGGGKIGNKIVAAKKLAKNSSVILVGGALDKKPFAAPKSSKIIIAIDFIKQNGSIQDIGPYSRRNFCCEIETARTIIWNGPVGNILKKKFQAGTREVAKCVADNREAFKVVGGGETVMFLKKIGLDKKMDFISTGGGAMLDFIAGKDFPGIKVLENNN